MKLIQPMVNVVTLLFIVSCAATTTPESTSNIDENCQQAKEKLAAVKDSSAKKSTLQAYYNKRCS